MQLPQEIHETIEDYKPRDRDMSTPTGKIMKQHIQEVGYVVWKHEKNCYRWGCHPERWTVIPADGDGMICGMVMEGSSEEAFKTYLGYNLYVSRSSKPSE